ncbi:MAG: VWA domain-containing protein [Alphaproteobacteria bacterium]
MLAGLVVLAADRATAACIAEVEPNDAMADAQAVAEAFCVAGSVDGPDQDTLLWQVDEAATWQLSLQGLPGQQAHLQLFALFFADDGTTAIQAETLADIAADGAAETPPAVLLPGRYGVLVSSDTGALFYRLNAVATPAPLPQPEPPGAQAGAFALTAAATAQVEVPWTLDADAAAMRWSLTATGPLGVPLFVQLRDADGLVLVNAVAADAAGTVRIADLGLAAGDYTIVALGAPEGSALAIAAAAEGARAPDREEEPNDDADRAFPVAAGVALAGRLIGSIAAEDSDCFAIAVDAAGAGRRYDIAARAPDGAGLTLAFVGADGMPAQQRRGDGAVRIADATLAEGRHVVCLSGSLPVDAGYVLTVADRGAPVAGAEIEPNDDAANAGRLADDGAAFGTLDGDDVDAFRFAVDGAAQLWLVQAAGEGLQRLTLYDSTATPVAEASDPDGTALLRIADLPLAAGDYVVEVAGRDGRYLLRATATGPANRTTDPDAVPEQEPNGSAVDGMALAGGRAVEGRLADAADIDVYRLSLANDTHVRLAIDLPGAVGLQATLSWGETGFDLGSLGASATADETRTVSWDGLLPAGEIYLALSSYDAAATPYRLTAEQASYFALPADLEPNDRWWQAAPLPADGRIAGTLGAQEGDWYRLPPLAAATTLSLTPDAPGGALDRAFVRVAQAIDLPGSWPPDDVTTLVALTFDGTAWTAELPAADRLFLAIEAAEGPYAGTVALAGTAAAATPPDVLRAELTLDSATVAAFVPQAQSVAGSLRLANAGGSPLDVTLHAHLGDSQWRLALPPGPVALAAGADVALPVALTVAPLAADNGPVQVEIAASADGTAPAVAGASIAPAVGAVVVGPQRAWRLPDPLLGGVDVAWAALGAVTVDGRPEMTDGFVNAIGTAQIAGYELATVQPTVDLAGDAPVDLIGFALDPGSLPVEDRLRDFAIETSLDGAAYTQALRGTLSPRPGLQGFVLPAPVAARFVRLVPLSNQARGSYVTLAELQAIAAPDALPSDLVGDGGPDIARPDLGGHVVWRLPQADDGVDIAADAPADAAAAEWVIGFAHGRAARIAGFAWQDDPAAPAETLAGAVALAASADSATGPWQDIGRWPLPAAGPLRFDAPVWARYLRVTAFAAAGATRMAYPQHVAVTEAPVGDDYRSILGSWGDDGAAAAFEWTHPEAIATGPLPPAAGPGPRPLPFNETRTGLLAGADARDSFVVDVPDGMDRLALTVDEPSGGRVGIAMTAADGSAAALERTEATAQHTRYVAPVAPGAYTVTLFQPPAAVAVLWDTSGSVQQLQPVMRAALADLINRLDPARTALNLFPFRGEVAPLLGDFTADRRALNRALAAYDWLDSSSDVELVMSAATEALFQADGRRAVVLLTDGESEPSPLASELWQRLAAQRPAVYGLLMPSIVPGEDRWRPAGLLRDWTLATGGFDLAVAASIGDYQTAWRRLAAVLEAPMAYGLTAGIPPEPGPAETGRGSIAVVAGDDGTALSAASYGAVEVLLDVSGSMLQRTPDGRRIAVAQATLARLAGEIVPAGAPFALRLFGQGAEGSCDTTLAVPPGPLDPVAAQAAIAGLQPVDGARTPIAQALALVAEDLAAATPPRLVILVTDGEETCDGDPAAEIARLAEAGIETRINIVGFAVDDAGLADTFRAWAAASGGVYLQAEDSASFDRAIADAMRPLCAIRGADGADVATVAVGGPPAEVPAGRYAVTCGEAEPIPASVADGEAATVRLP